MIKIYGYVGAVKASIIAETMRKTGEVCGIIRIIDEMLDNKHIGGPGHCSGYGI